MKKILVVYDQPEIFYLMSEISSIKQTPVKGFFVDFAFDWQAGFKKYVNNHFDMIISGLPMPKYVRHELSKEIRNSNGHHTFLIGISRTPRELISKYYDVIFQKPFRLKNMMDKVRHLLQGEEECKMAV